MKRMTALASSLLVIAVLAGACSLPAPSARTWKVKPASITVHDGEDNDAGDEPYVIQVGFRSKLGVPNSSSASIASQCYTRTVPPTDAAPDGTTLAVPAGAADIVFPEAQNLDLGDVLLNTAPLEIFGTLSFAMERDGLFADSCAITDALNNALVPVLAQALNTLIANSAVPPTQGELIALIVDNLGNFLGAAGSFIAAILEGLGNPDDIIGVAAQIHLPTAGALTGLLNAGFAVGGLFLPGLENGFIPLEGLPSSFQIRVGTLEPSAATFRFDSAVADYSLRTEVGA